MSALASLLLTNAAAAGVLAALAWSVSRFSRRQALVHGLWLLAVAKLVTPPVLPLPVLPSWSSLWPAPSVLVVPIPAAPRRTAKLLPVETLPASPSGPSAARRRTATTVETRPVPVEPVAPLALPAATGPWPAAFDVSAAAAWLLAIGALAILVLTGMRFVRFQCLLAGGEPAAEPVARRTRALARQLGLRRAPLVWLVSDELPPLLWPSATGPKLVLPTGLLEQLTDPELDALLAHELAHVRRADHWVRLVEVAATALFWWYPVTWWSRRALRRAEERCCDEWVLRVLPSSAEAYASGLLKSLTFVSGAGPALPVGASGAGPVDDLEARLKEILMTRPLPQLSRPWRISLASAAVIGLAVFPTHAQPGRVAGEASTPAAADEQAKPPTQPRAGRAAKAGPVTATTPAAPATATAPVAAPATAVAPVTAAPATEASTPVPAAPPPAPAVALAPRTEGVPFTVRALAGPHALVAVPGVVGGLPRGVLGGVTGGVPGGVPGGGVRALVAGLGPLALLDDEDPALAAERRALEDQRHQLRQQQLQLEGKSLELEARSEQARLKAEADRLRAQGRTAELARIEKEGQLNARRHELRRRQLQLEQERAGLEAELGRAEDAVAALEKSGRSEQGQRQLQEAHEQRERAVRDLEQRQQTLEAEAEKAEQEERALESEQRVQELRQSSDELRHELAERIRALHEALPEAGAQKTELASEIRRLEAALGALGGGDQPAPAPRPSTVTTPKPLPRPAPPPQPQPKP